MGDDFLQRLDNQTTTALDEVWSERRNQEATNQFYSAITGSRPLPAFMNPENLDRIMAHAEIEAER